jgi:hypothetical protein
MISMLGLGRACKGERGRCGNGIGCPVAASQAYFQSSNSEALDLNSWKEDQKSLGYSLPASGLLRR